MTPPTLLTGRLYLLGYNARRERVSGGQYHGLTVRAAALEELRLNGSIVDEGGKVRTTGQRPVDDPVLQALLREISDSTRLRPWRHWVSIHARGTFRAVRDQCEDRLLVRVEAHRVLGIFPATRVYVRDRAAVDAVRAEFERVLAGTGSTTPREAALVALAAAGELGTVLPWRRRRQFRARLAELTTASPLPTALHKVIQSKRAAAASAGGSS